MPFFEEKRRQNYLHRNLKTEIFVLTQIKKHDSTSRPRCPSNSNVVQPLTRDEHCSTGRSGISNDIFDRNFDFWQKFIFLTKIFICDQNVYFWLKFRFLTHISIFIKIYIFDQNFDFWPVILAGHVPIFVFNTSIESEAFFKWTNECQNYWTWTQDGIQSLPNYGKWDDYANRLRFR